jgi:phage recombination protein Bet
MEEIPDPKVPPDPVTRKTVDDYLRAMGLADQVTPEVADRFASLAVRYQLNPFLRELHLVPGGGKHVAVVGYEVYLKKAERTGKLDGWRTWTEGEGADLKAVLEVYRHDWAHPFVHEVFFAEVAQRDDKGEVTGFWKRMPKFQLRKVAISQGFRLAFPDELGGIPYEAAELSLDHSPTESGKQSKGELKSPQVAGPRSVFAELDEYLTTNAEAFTKKHLGWIRDQLEKTPTLEKAKAMLGYARKVVIQGADDTDQPRAPRTYANRGRKPEPAAEPVF